MEELYSNEELERIFTKERLEPSFAIHCVNKESYKELMKVLAHLKYSFEYGDSPIDYDLWLGQPIHYIGISSDKKICIIPNPSNEIKIKSQKKFYDSQNLDYMNVKFIQDMYIFPTKK